MEETGPCFIDSTVRRSVERNRKFQPRETRARKKEREREDKEAGTAVSHKSLGRIISWPVRVFGRCHQGKMLGA